MTFSLDKILSSFRRLFWRLRVSLLFDDVTVLFDRLKKRRQSDTIPVDQVFCLSADDLIGFPEADRLLETPSAALPYADALPLLRSSVSNTIVRFERRLLLRMAGIHFVDVLMSLAGAVCSMGVLWIFEKGLSTQWEPHRIGIALLLTVVVFLLNVGSSALHCRKIDWETLLAYRIRTLLSRYIFSHSLAISSEVRNRYSTGELLGYATQDAKHLGHYYAHGYVDLFVLAASSAILLLIMFYFFGSAAAVGFCIFLLHLPLVYFFSRMSRKQNTLLMEKTSERLGLVTEWLQGMRLVRYFGWGREFLVAIFQSSTAEYRKLRGLHTQYSLAFAVSTSWWVMVALSILGAMLWMDGVPSVSSVFGVVWLSARLGSLLNPLPWFVAAGAMAKVSDERMRGYFSSPTVMESLPQDTLDSFPTEVANLLAADVIGVGFSIRNLEVCFGDSARPALVIPSLDIVPGRSLAIVGGVGSGKSVLENVLLGEILPSKGVVSLVLRWLDEGAMRETHVPLSSQRGLGFLRELVAFVPQQSVVFSAAVRENVPLELKGNDASRGLLDGPDLDLSQERDADIIQALAKASLEQDIRSFPDGLATLIGERGINLSGGQKQRLSIGRAHYLDRQLVVLDDPLSAVDRDTEQQLSDALFGAGDESCNDSGGLLQPRMKTIVIATHRLSCVARCDDVLLLEDGVSVCMGPVAEVMAGDTQLTRWLRAHDKP